MGDAHQEVEQEEEYGVHTHEEEEEEEEEEDQLIEEEQPYKAQGQVKKKHPCRVTEGKYYATAVLLLGYLHVKQRHAGLRKRNTEFTKSPRISTGGSRPTRNSNSGSSKTACASAGRQSGQNPG